MDNPPHTSPAPVQSDRPRLALLLVLYALVSALPGMVAMGIGPALAGQGAPAGRGFWVELGVALGYAALGLMATQFALIGRYAHLARRVGQDRLLRLHAWAGIGAAVLLVAHPVVLILADRDFAAFFDPRVNFLRAMALSFAMAAILALVVLSVARRRLALAYEWWRVSHALLAAMLMLVALAHSIMVGHYTASIGMIALMAAYTLGPLAMLAWVRVVTPMRREPWHVTSVTHECERVWTVNIQADAPGSGIRFEPGQFAWLTFDKSPFHPRQHPFSIASSAGPTGTRQDHLAFTIKELGDFTRTIGSLTPGTRAWVDGPVGGFVLPDSAPGAILIAGGIGITPMMSTLRTMADRGDNRPVTLIYASATLEKAAFTDELDQLTKTLALRVVHVPEKPPEGWEGPSGFINPQMLATLLSPEAIAAHTAMVCGPVPMINAVHQALIRCGVHRARIKSERFEMLA